MRSIFLAVLLLAGATLTAQTIVKISNVTVTEKEAVAQGKDVSTALNGSEGSEKMTLFTDGPLAVRTWFKITTHKSPRSSSKESAVNLIVELDLLENGRKTTAAWRRSFTCIRSAAPPSPRSS